MDKQFRKQFGFIAIWVCAVFTCRTASAENIVISEVMYNPPSGMPEYIEIFNNTATPYDIALWKISDGIEFQLPGFSDSDPQATFLKPFERLVFSSANAETTRAAYNIPAGVRVFGGWRGNLSDSGERITLWDKNGIKVCTLEYEDRGRWPIAADGAGHSLVLRNPDRPIDDWRNWTFSKRRLGTPGTEPVIAPEQPIPSPEMDLDQGIAIVDYGDRWKYHAGGSDLGTAWRQTGFDDNGWASGPGLLGFENAVLPEPGLRTRFNSNGQLTYYFRLNFNFNGSPAGVRLFLDQIVDDGAVYYLNGTEIGRVGMPSGPVTFSTAANRTVGDASEEVNVFTIDSGALRAGNNVLAVEVHQTNPTSSDLVFGARLRTLVPTNKGVVINEVFPAAIGKGFIEFFNPTSSAINLKGFYLSDDSNNLRKWAIANDLNVPARGYASVGYSESGFSLSVPGAIYLSSPEGTVVNGVRSNYPSDGRSLGRKPAGGPDWFLFADPTRNRPNGSEDDARVAFRLNEVHLGSSNKVEWVELYNSSPDSLSLDGLFLSSRRDFGDRMAFQGDVPGRGYAVIFTDFILDRNQVSLFLATAANTVIQAELLERNSAGQTLQVYPDGGGEWYRSETATPNKTNNPERNTDVVINEIMFNPPSDEMEGEYIELFNRGSRSVDLSGWKFVEGIEFTFPAGTTLSAGEYLVVASSTEKMRAVYGAIPLLGTFRGRLSNDGELVRLVDGRGNLANEVDYRIGGDWPDLTKGKGSSMELVSPWADNRLASAWRDSDESNKGAWRSYSTRGTYLQLNSTGSPSDYKELHFHLVGDSHVILQDIELVKVGGDGSNLILNADQLSANNYSASGWLAQGTHWSSYLESGKLHIIADGRGDNRPNRVEIDIPGIVRNDLCELRFKGRWVSGNPRLIAQTWDHSIAGSFRLEIPENLGTPGKANSRALSVPPPQIEELLHSPAVPRSSQSVKVTARVSSSAPLGAVEVFHRIDNANANATWQSKQMFDDGSNGDEIAGDGLYTAELTEHRVNGRIVQFYVRAQAENGQVYQLPKLGSKKPAMYVVDDKTVGGDLRTARFIVSAYDLGAISNGGSAKYNYKFPRLQNHYFNMTFISNERDVYYGGEIRNSGSPWTRGGDLSRGKWKLPDDRRFRGGYKFTFDNDAGNGQLTHNRITRYMLYLMGHPVNENEYIRVMINSGSAELKEDTEAIDNDFLNRLFENGSSGDLYRIDDEWWFTDSWQRTSRNADWSYKGTDNPGRYRTEWMKRTNEDEDDFTALIHFFKTVSGNYTQSQIERLLDPHATLIMSVVRGYISDWDSFSLSRGKNGWFYRRPTDGRFQFLHWDSDLAFGDANARLFSGMTGFNTWINKPYNRRLFYSYLVELLENYTKDSPRMEAWLRAEEEASTAYSNRATFYRNWFNARRARCLTEMGANYTRPFEITSNGGAPISTSEHSLELRGTAPYGVIQLVVVGHPEAQGAWVSDTTWSLSGIRLKQGENFLTVQGRDQWGKVLKETSIRINKVTDAPPAIQLQSAPASLILDFKSSLELDARSSVDPEGGPLAFEWKTPDAPTVSLITNPHGRATALFPRPGIYTVQLQATDPAGNLAQTQREAAVYGPGDFSSFGGRVLDPGWTLENIEYRNNTPGNAWYSLTEVAGELTFQLSGDESKPLRFSAPEFPWMWRTLPRQGDWALQTKVRLDTRQFGAFTTGLLFELVDGIATNRYAIGLDGGDHISVKTLRPDGTVMNLALRTYGKGEAIFRVRRIGSDISFAVLEDENWTLVHRLRVAETAKASRGGVFTATGQPQGIKVGFDYALLVDPGNTSVLRENLRISEIMYHPIGGDDYEYLEMVNIGEETLDLTGARFTTGISFVFGTTFLGANERLVLAKNPAIFGSRYGTAGIRVTGPYDGKLDNGGEILTLVDKEQNIVFAISYDDEEDWPGRADGFGSSLEVVELRGDLQDPKNWRSSSEFNGSPGRAGAGPVRTVMINEVLAHSDPPLEDAIELFNNTGNAVDVGGWFLSDSRAVLKKFRIPNGTIIPANGYRVFYEYQFNTNNALVPFSLSSSQGDEVYLSSADVAGNLVQFIDDVKFGPSENGISLGRYPNGTGKLVAMEAMSFGSAVTRDDPPEMNAQFRSGAGAPNGNPKVGPVIFSRIMYHPPDGQDEFIEVTNISGSPVSLHDPLHPENRWKVSGGIEFSFPADSMIPSNGRALVANIDPAQFRAKYNVPASIQIFGPFQGALNNGGESIELLKPDMPQFRPPDAGFVPYILVEEIRYNNRMPWPVAAAGSGALLKRVAWNQFGNDPVNWTAEILNFAGDTDGDGVPDEWEIAHGLNPNSAEDALQDSDGDGANNLTEYLSGTDPRNAASVFAITRVQVSSNTVTLTFPVVSGRSYAVYYCDNLRGGAWFKLRDLTASVSGSVEVTDSAAPRERFYRITTTR